MDIEQFISIVTTTPSADNSQPWEFTLDEQTLSVHYLHRSNSPDPFGAFGHGALISGGALQETIEMVLAFGGQPNAEITTNMTNQGWFINTPISAIQDANGNADYSSIVKRHTNRHPFRSLNESKSASTTMGASCRVLTLINRSDIKRLASCLQTCSEARFNNQELHEWLFSSLRWNEDEAKNGTGLDISTLHLPPGGRHVMRFLAPWERMKSLNRLGLYKIMAAADTALFGKAPAIMAFIGKKSYANSAWNTGKCIQRTWIELNQKGIAVHPYYATIDLANRLKNGKLDEKWAIKVGNALEEIKGSLLLNDDEELHMLFRIGMPTISPVKSRRLPAIAFIQQ